MNLITLNVYKLALNSAFELKQQSVIFEVIKSFLLYLELPQFFWSDNKIYPLTFLSLQINDDIFIQSYSNEILWHHRLGVKNYENVTGKKCYQINDLHFQKNKKKCADCPVNKSINQKKIVSKKTGPGIIIVFPFKDYFIRIIKKVHHKDETLLNKKVPHNDETLLNNQKNKKECDDIRKSLKLVTYA